MKVRWVVVSGYKDDADNPFVYLASMERALEGAGVDGRAYTQELRRARKYKYNSTARAVARRLYRCRVERVELPR